MKITEKWDQRPDCSNQGNPYGPSRLSYWGRLGLLVLVAQSTPVSINTNGAAISRDVRAASLLLVFASAMKS